MKDSQIIGYRKNGSPIRLIAGASEPAVEPAAGPAVEKPAQEPETSPDIVKLQAALEKEREARRAADKKAKENDTYRVKVEELEAASKSELERAVDVARKEGESSALQRANTRLVSYAAIALAAQQQFRDASDAVKFLDLTDITVADDGTVDSGSLTKQLEQLAKDKPYLLVDTRPTRPQGDVGQGPRPAVTPEVTPGMGRIRAAYASPPQK
jgi:hypothetical protein